MGIGSIVATFFKALWHVFVPAAENAIKDFLSKITPDVERVAIDAIQYVKTLGLGGTEARDAAVDKIKADLATLGHDSGVFALNELHALVELLYVAAKPVPADAAVVTSEPV